MHVPLKQRDPRATLVACRLVLVSLQLGVCGHKLAISPGRDEVSRHELVFGDVEVGEAGVEGTVWTDVGTDLEDLEAAQGKIGLPFEAFDVGAERGVGFLRWMDPECWVGELFFGRWEGDGWVGVQWK
jgi:hypothetical protein